MAVRLAVDPSEDLDQIIAKIKSQNSKDITLALPPETRALQELNNFYALRTAARSSGINLSFAGGNKTIRGLAKLLGFTVVDKDGEEAGGEFEPSVPSIAAPSPSRSFGVPEGFVVAQPANPAPSVTPPQITPPAYSDTPPPQRTNAQDFFNEMNNFDPGMPTQRIQPPPVKNNGNGNRLAGPGDEVLSRENIPDFFNNSADGGDRSNRQPPRPEFDFGAEGGTMSFEQASRSGLIGNGNLGNGFVPTPLEDNLTQNDLEDDTPIIPNEDDNAAGAFRTNGRRPGRGGVRDESVPVRPNRKTPNQRKARPVRVGAVAGPTIVERVQRILVPVQPRQGGITMAAPTLTPEAKRDRDRQRRRATLLTLLGIAAAIALFILILFLVLKPGGGDTPSAPPPIALNVPLKTSPVQNTVRLAVDTGSVSGAAATPTTAAATIGITTGTPGTAITAATPGDSRLLVQTVNTGEIKKSGDGTATGSREVPDKSASGPVTFYNVGPAVTYGANALILTRNGVNYRLVQTVTVPAGSVLGNVRSTAGGTVVADKAGTAGNLPQATSFNLTAASAVQIGPIAGGTNKTEKFVTQPDLDNLKKQLQDTARNEANGALKFDPATQAALVVKSNEPVCTFRKNVNEVVDDTGKFQGTCTTTMDAVIYNKQQLNDAVKTQMVKDPNYKLDDTSKVTLTDDPKIEDVNGQRVITVGASGKQIGTLDTEKFKNDIAGKTKDDIIKMVLPTYPQVDPTLFASVLDKVQDTTLPVANRLDVQAMPDYQVAQSLTPTDPNLTPGGTPGLPQGGSSLPRTPVTTARP